MLAKLRIPRPARLVAMSLSCFAFCIVSLLSQRAGSQMPSAKGEEFITELRGNVVRVDTTFGKSQEGKTGFGFIVGEAEGQLVIVTANHVVRSSDPDAGDSRITVTFFGGAQGQATLLPRRHETHDLAVLQVGSPAKFKWIAESVAPSTEVVRNREAWIIGRRGDWEIPTKGSAKIGRVLDQGALIEVDTAVVSAGTSGAPLVTENGIVGMITTDMPGEVVKVLSVDAIRRSLEEWSYRWSAQEVRTSYWGVPPASAILSTVDIAPDQREIFIALEKTPYVAVFAADSQRRIGEIEIGNPALPNGRPQILGMAPRRGQNGELYVVDGNANELVVFDRRNYRAGHIARIPVGQNPRFMAITPDQRKAYVSNERPVPQGSISVIDLVSHRVTRTITGVNCPEGLVLSPDGTRLFVVTQCGAGQDPLFIIDTATDAVLKGVPGFAVGLDLVISPDGGKLYIARGSYQTRDTATGQVTTVPSQLSVVRTSDNQKVKTLTIAVRALAFTADGRQLLVGGDKVVRMIDTASDEVVNTIPLSASPTGIVTTRDNKAYMWLPDENRLFLLGLSGLLGSGR
jgi:DNA-binding beta-propeller fold protein YncE